MIHSPKQGSRLAYATSDNPTGPYTYRGYIVDNGVDYPGGNNHGSVACINGQWYIFYHRMTNGTIMSRRGCVEKIEILPDGTIPTVEMTSSGFEDSLDPYEITPAGIAFVLKGKAFITERNVFDRAVIDIQDGDIIGYKYFDFGEDYSSKTMEFATGIKGLGCDCQMHIFADDMEIGVCDIGQDSGICKYEPFGISAFIQENVRGKRNKRCDKLQSGADKKTSFINRSDRFGDRIKMRLPD